jgi:hypothetical protein
MTPIESWPNVATRSLCDDAKARLRRISRRHAKRSFACTCVPKPELGNEGNEGNVG